MLPIKAIHHTPGIVLLMRNSTNKFCDDGTIEVVGELIEELTVEQARQLADQILRACIFAEIEEART